MLPIENMITRIEKLLINDADRLLLTNSSRALVSCDRIRATFGKCGKPIEPLDPLIIACVLSFGTILVTNDAREFERVSALRISAS